MTPEADKPTVLARERVSIRERGRAVTLGAWRVELALPGGARGEIVFAEPWYRGEGALLGMSQEKLAELWRAALPPDDSPQDWPQYG